MHRARSRFIRQAFVLALVLAFWSGKLIHGQDETQIPAPGMMELATSLQLTPFPALAKGAIALSPEISPLLGSAINEPPAEAPPPNGSEMYGDREDKPQADGRRFETAAPLHPSNNASTSPQGGRPVQPSGIIPCLGTCLGSIGVSPYMIVMCAVQCGTGNIIACAACVGFGVTAIGLCYIMCDVYR